MSSVAHAFLIASGHPFLDSCHGRFVSPLKVGIFQVRHQHRCYLYAEARRSCLSNDCLSANYISRSNYSSNGLLCESKVTNISLCALISPPCSASLRSHTPFVYKSWIVSIDIRQQSTASRTARLTILVKPCSILPAAMVGQTIYDETPPLMFAVLAMAALLYAGADSNVSRLRFSFRHPRVLSVG